MKNIILISPDTFEYYKAICKALTRKGYAPLWLNQLPSTSVASRVFFRLAPSLARYLATGYFVRKINKIDRVDLILIIKGEGISEKAIAAMRARFPDVKIVYYLWDSLANVPGAERKITLSDAAYSFDPVDCDRTEELQHLPLFHSKCPTDTKPDPTPGFAAFIGTLHSNRYQLNRKLSEKIHEITGIKPFLYFYYPNRALFMILRLAKKTFRSIRLSDVHFEPVPRERYDAIQLDAEIVIDICHPKQSGLTMRSIEALGDGKKLITNNKMVRSYDFYLPENCYVVDGEPGEDFRHFLESAYQPPAPALVTKYHIDSWIQTLVTTGHA